jgi:hypothetical protein
MANVGIAFCIFGEDFRHSSLCAKIYQAPSHLLKQTLLAHQAQELLRKPSVRLKGHSRAP